jgi:hypothetical protein
MVFLALDNNVMSQLASSYFDTFDLLYPFMDRQDFMQNTLSKIYLEGFGNDNDSIIALLIFALGDLAIGTTRGESVDIGNGRPSRGRRSIYAEHPGLALFTEARRRMGFVLTDCQLENVQIFCLTA